MPQHTKDNILAGRNAVDAYREAHHQLHSKPWHKGIPEEHTPLLDNLLVELKEPGFASVDQFFDASDEQNMQELGFASKEDFEANATDTDRIALEEMWR
jgi:hypothetical protein